MKYKFWTAKYLYALAVLIATASIPSVSHANWVLMTNQKGCPQYMTPIRKIGNKAVFRVKSDCRYSRFASQVTYMRQIMWVENSPVGSNNNRTQGSLVTDVFPRGSLQPFIDKTLRVSCDGNALREWKPTSSLRVKTHNSNNGSPLNRNWRTYRTLHCG